MNKKPTPRQSISRKPSRPKRKPPDSIKKSSKLKSPGEAIIPSKTFHETFPITLEYMDGKDFKRCFFICIEHCEAYVKRYKLKKDSFKLFETTPRNEKEV